MDVCSNFQDFFQWRPDFEDFQMGHSLFDAEDCHAMLLETGFEPIHIEVSETLSVFKDSESSEKEVKPALNP